MRIPYFEYLTEPVQFMYNGVWHKGRWHLNATWHILENTHNTCTSPDAWWPEPLLAILPPHPDNFSDPFQWGDTWWITNRLSGQYTKYADWHAAGNQWFDCDYARVGSPIPRSLQREANESSDLNDSQMFWIRKSASRQVMICLINLNSMS